MTHTNFGAVLLAVTLIACGGTADSSPSDDGVTTVGGSGGAPTSGGAGGTGGAGGDGGTTPVASCTTPLPLEELGVPGLAVGIVAHGELACASAAGLAIRETNQAATPHTVFAWASVSKTITATAVMMLVDDGAFGLDDDVDTLLPFTIDNPSCAGAPITVRQLLTHTSSIIDSDAYDDAYTIGDSPVPLETFLESYLTPGGVLYDPDASYDYDCPGTYGEYTNVGVALLGQIVASVSGMSFDDFCRERIFDPLAMGPASFHLAKLDEGQVAMPYGGSTAETFVPLGHTGFPTYPDGSFRGSVVDLARLLAMMPTGGVYGATRLLEETTVDEIERIQNPGLDDAQGLIWYHDFDGWIGHNGGDPGTSSQMFYDPVAGTGVLMVANGDWYDANDDSDLADALLTQLFEEAASY